MAHDTHHGHSKENKTIISFKNSFWLIIIIVGLFIAALNFVQAEGGGKGESKPRVEEAAAPANEKSAGEIRSETKSVVPSPSENTTTATDTTKAK